ncbi:type II toxin-antitoxin system HicB family antitoxin [Campylobacter mucosalis]|uniref:Putative RNA nuclease (UPF0150 domain protein) n=1 Tax=Campylobacter mucosalis CCUG 21559 TaxID=1032067 RepID=A0A6G5QGS7_9BACT|nr:type II toxin-antitoxin system HicB family antitoxin [Campylobacter mucosalis]QCD44777.1 putative RNA nuclease (UPF0150 domain protein [Campylobacter mucosalis CCUG 21559]
MKNLDYYLNLPYKIELKKIPESEGGGWGAFMPELNSVAFFYGDGQTKQEALDELEVAFRISIETLLKDKVKIPEPYDENKKVRVNVSLSQGLLNSIDSVSKNRSAFLEKAASMALANAL